MDFKNTPPKWDAAGTQPSSDLQINGFVAGYKPPAPYFNYLFHMYTECVKELQTSLKGHAESAENPHKVTAAQVDALKRSVAFSCGANTTVLDIVNAFNDKTIGICERLAMGTYGNSDYSYGYGMLLRAVYDNTYQGYIVKMLVWDDDSKKVGILYGRSKDGSLLLKDAEHYTFYHEGNMPTPADIGALSIAGGTLTGNLKIAGGNCAFSGDAATANIMAYSDPSKDYKRTLQLMNESYEDDIATSLIMINKNAGGSSNYIIHGTHNKPTGSYIGNRSSTRRDIEIGGIGDALLINGNGIAGIVFGTGMILLNKDGTVSAMQSSDIYFSDGKLVLRTDSEIINFLGGIYNYQVL